MTNAVEWLLEGDPAIRWQVMRDLLDAPAPKVERERKKTTRSGWGARLLALQDRGGTWGRGLYSPKWISTTYTMLLLRDLGVPPDSPRLRRGCSLLLDEGLKRDGGINFEWGSRAETCITGMVLSILSYFEYDDDRLDTVADHLLAQQMVDGGWNCEFARGRATHASFHTTISALEGLRFYEQHRGRKRSVVRAAQRRGRELLLQHRLYRSHRTGEVVKPVFLLLSFPPRWHYDILRALDYFQSADAERDDRLAEAIELVRQKERADGRWPLQNRYRGKVFFEMERIGAPSRWNTLRALRVLRWWDGSRSERSSRRFEGRSE